MMAPDLWKRVKELFATAAPLEPDARGSFLREVCGDDDELQRQVERLLVQHDAGGGLLGGESESEWILSRTAESPAFSNEEVLGERFRIVGYIGRGGMGEVYEADDLELGGRIALKALRAELLADDRNISRFKREIQLARRVTHPHVCRIFDVGRHRRSGEEREHSFLTMELLAGETLASFLKTHGRLSSERAWPLIIQMAEGLDALHRASVIHRDFKPGNVMLTRDGEGGLRAVITDFGLAHHVTREAGGVVAGTGAGQIIGTLDYMAPEQLLGKSAGPATDIYAFGVVCYEMLTAQKPFAGRDRWEPPASTRELAPELPPNWDRTIQSCLQTSAAARPASMAAVVAGFGMPATGGRLDQLAPGSTMALDSGSSAGEKTGRRFSLRRRHILWLVAGSGAAALAVANLDWPGGEPTSHTASPEAAEAFERALEDTRLGRYQAASDQLREAVRRDPAFALAHIVLAKVQMTLGRYSQGHESAQTAFDLTTRNPERYTIWDHYRVLARYKHLRREFSAARDDFRALAGFALERAEGLWFDRQAYHSVAVEAFRERALIYSHEGFPLEAQKEIRKAKQYDPQNYSLDVLESLFLVAQGNGSDALEMAQQAARKAAKRSSPPDVYPAWAEGMAWLLLDNPVRAHESFTQLARARAPVLSAWGHLFEAQALVYSGDWPQAMAKLSETDTPDRADMISEVWMNRQLWTAWLASLMGSDWKGPLHRLEEVAGTDPSPQHVEVFRDAAVLAARHKDTAMVQRFRSLLEAVERGFPALRSSSDSPESIAFVHYHAEFVRGEEALLLGQTDRAARIFSDQAHMFLCDPQSWMSLAQVQASLGDWNEAVESYRRIMALQGQILTWCIPMVLPLAHLELARCLRQVSQFADARQSYDAFLKSAGKTELAAKATAERNTLPL